MSWDYALDDNNDIKIDVNGDIEMVGSIYSSDLDKEIVLQDIKFAIYLNEFEIQELEDDLLIQNYLKSLFIKDTRIKNLEVFVENGKYNISFDMK